MFTGISDHTIDEKGRIILPARFRQELGETFVVTKGFFECVQVLSVEEFRKFRDKIDNLDAGSSFALKYTVIAYAKEVTPNSQGRVPLEKNLRAAAGLSKDVVVVGMDNRLEIWDKEKFEKFIANNQPTVEAALSLLNL